MFNIVNFFNIIIKMPDACKFLEEKEKHNLKEC